MERDIKEIYKQFEDVRHEVLNLLASVKGVLLNLARRCEEAEKKIKEMENSLLNGDG